MLITQFIEDLSRKVLATFYLSKKMAHSVKIYHKERKNELFSTMFGTKILEEKLSTAYNYNSPYPSEESVVIYLLTMQGYCVLNQYSKI